MSYSMKSKPPTPTPISALVIQHPDIRFLQAARQLMALAQQKYPSTSNPQPQKAGNETLKNLSAPPPSTVSNLLHYMRS